MVEYELTLCIGQESTNRGVVIKCHDDGVTLTTRFVTCHQVSKWRMVEEPFVIPAGSTAILKIGKPDKTSCLKAGKLDGVGFSFDLPPQACTVVGTADAEVAIYGPNGRHVTSATFPIHIPPECVCNCEMESAPYIDILGEQINLAREAEAGAKAAAKAAMDAQVNGPKIRDNGNWYVWDLEKEEYADTGVSAGGNGATFMPTISENGVISWENDKNYKNPKPVDLAAAVLGAFPEEIKGIQIYGNDTHNAEFIRLGEIIGAPIVGHILDDKVIRLTGDIPKGVYKFQIVKTDGSTAELCTYEVV